MTRNRWAVGTALASTLMALMGGSIAMANEEAEKQAVAAVETVTPMRDPDGEWRVGGYFIK